MVYTVRFFPLQNSVCFINLTYLVPVLFTFCIQGVLKLKKNNSGAKRLTSWNPLDHSSSVMGLIYLILIYSCVQTEYIILYNLTNKLHNHQRHLTTEVQSEEIWRKSKQSAQR